MRTLVVTIMITLMFVPLATSGMSARVKPDKPGKPTPEDPDPTPAAPWDYYGNDGGEKYALCIGISNYEGRTADLKYCDDDAKAWKDYYVSQGYYVMLLLDLDATADNMEAAFIALNALEDASTDTVVVTYSGHGGWYDNSYKSCIISADLYWCTNGWMASFFDSYDSQEMFFFFDSCESGTFATALAGQGRVIVVGSGFAGSYTYDDKATRHGIFSYFGLVATNQFNYAEGIANYAMDNFADWCSVRGVTANSQYTDNFNGNLYI